MNAMIFIAPVSPAGDATRVNDMSNRDRVTIDRTAIEIDRDGNWKKIVHMLQPYQEPFGTIQVGAGPVGILAFDKQLNEFIQIFAHGTSRTPLNQRKVRAALELPVGRPRKGYEVRELRSMRLEPSVIEYLTKLGDDNLAEGVAIAAKFHEEHRTKGKK